MMGTGSIAERWRLLSGDNNWKNLLDPLDIDLRRYIIHYGEMAQAAYDTFDAEKASKFAGSSIYARKDLFSRVGIDKANPFKYNPTKYLYATSQIPVPEAFILKSISPNTVCEESNWIGYVAAATDEGKAALGRRDILVAWRGTIRTMEWIDDFDFSLVSASDILGETGDPNVHGGWLSIYTSDNPNSPYSKTSARYQVITEVKRLVDEFVDEEISITICGHSLGAALGILNAADIVANGVNRPENDTQKPCPVTAFLFACPRVGDLNFTNIILSMEDLHLLRVCNSPDLVPLYPLIGYADVGEELVINTGKSSFLKISGELSSWHNLEAYLHGVAGTQGAEGGFHLEVKRDIALVNKKLDALKDEYLVPASWWCQQNKGMVQMADGSWKLEDHEEDNSEL
ncbi:phospholipase A1-II 1 [Malania oleifera]|uniref:phospholipase A1-II 1 n=1 Tax=Malania oleifera TaxID=397392 RepID=UPI0025AEA9F8|nr:phospholipase A1-II 1 [Malania oleifera]